MQGLAALRAHELGLVFDVHRVGLKVHWRGLHLLEPMRGVATRCLDRGPCDKWHFQGLACPCDRPAGQNCLA